MADARVMLQTLEGYKLKYISAQARNAGVQAAKTHIMNYLFNNLDQIIEILSNADGYEAQIERLKKTISEADEEYNALHKEYKRLKSEAAKSKGSSAKE